MEGVEDLSSCDISAFYNGEYQYFGFRHYQNREAELPFVTLQIPSSISKSIGILMNMGDCEVQNVHCDSLEVQSESVDVDLDCYSAQTKVQTESGDIRLNTSSWTLDLSTGSGDISAIAPATSTSIQTGSGDIEINLKGCCSRLDSHSEAGDVSDSGGEEGPKITGEVRTGSGDILIR